MGNRGQKRADSDEELPADKRACSSLDFRPSSSGSSAQTPTNSPNLAPEAREGDMDTSSSSSESSHSDGGERDSAYGSCDSDEMDVEQRQRRDTYRDYQERRSSADHAKLQGVLGSLSEEVEQSTQLAALTELCEVLSFSVDSSLSNPMVDSLSQNLVKLARHESNPDIMLLAIRAITYLCDVHSRSSSYLVRHNAVPALCQRLMIIEYLDVAEQCLQALEKISREQPLHCVQAGAIMAVLGYIDFFSTSVQRVALKTVVNICKKLPSKYPPSLMEAIPVLCNLLQYEDGQLVENVATCLIKIAERVCDSPGMLDELCKHGLIHQATHLIDLNSRITLCPPVHSGLIGLLVKLASGSIIAFRTLFELNISNILKDILSTYDLSHGGMPSHFMVDGNRNQVHEVLKLLDELLPAIVRDQDMQLNMDKESFLVKQPHLLQKFALDLLPVLTQVVNSGVSLYVCYGCLSVIYKLVYFSSSDMLLELLKCTNISSFLAGVFTRKDHHVLILALQTVDNILQKLSDVFLSSFIKEGVLFAVDALVTPEKCSQFVFQMFNGMQLTSDQSQSPKSALRDVPRCLCYAFVSNKQSPSTSESGSCKFEKDYGHKLATRIRSDYFAAQLLNSEEGTTDILQKLKMMSATLTNMVNSSTHNEEEFYHILHQIMAQLNGSDPISTFEFLESGIIRSLLSYLSNGGQCFNRASSQQVYTVEKRFEVLGRLLLSSSDPMGNLYLSALVQKLQSALSSVENFPIVLGQVSKRINSYAIIPHGCNTTYPCLKVQFVKGEGEEFLGDYSGEVFTVDPFSQLDAIDGYLWPKVTGATPAHSPARSTAGSGSPECRSPDLVKSESISSDHEIEKEKPDLQDESGEVASSGKTTGESTDMNEEVLTDSGEQQHTSSSDEDNNLMTESSESPRKGEAASPNLSFYLDGQQLDHSLTLYQAILQQQTKAEHAVTSAATIWSQAYKLTYRRAVKHNYVLEKIGNYRLYTPFFSDVFLSDLTSDVEKSSPAYDILFLLKSLEGMNRFRFHLMSRERACSFAEGRIDNLDNLKVAISDLRNEFVNTRLTEKLEQQMRDPLFVSVGGMPSWCGQLMASCPFLFSFEARCTYFRLAALGQRQVQPHASSQNNVGGLNGGRQRNNSNLPRKKFLVDRNFILESATQMMDLHAHQKFVLEVEYEEEVGTGLGPTLEFYTLVSHEFQKFGLGMWREDHMSFTRDSATLMSPFGLFPRPWSSAVNISNGIEFTEVVKKYVLLGQVVAKALKDGRVLDIPFSKSFYKLILGQDLTVYDIPSFDFGLGTALLEFQAIVERKQYLQSLAGDKSTCQIESCFRNTRIEDLYLDFTLPGYPDFVFTPGTDSKMVDMINLEEYVSLIVDATLSSGISRQVEAFKLGFNQVFPIRHLQILSEEELERLLCGECELWNLNELLDHVKFDHGYTASSPPVMNLLAIIREFDREQQKAFLRFVTGAPRLPRGGLASLNPKLTIVRKHCGKCADADLPSVMTCANYLKLPPYSTKETMKEKLLYAIIEGQGSFHLS